MLCLHLGTGLFLKLKKIVGKIEVKSGNTPVKAEKSETIFSSNSHKEIFTYLNGYENGLNEFLRVKHHSKQHILNFILNNLHFDTGFPPPEEELKLGIFPNYQMFFFMYRQGNYIPIKTPDGIILPDPCEPPIAYFDLDTKITPIPNNLNKDNEFKYKICRFCSNLTRIGCLLDSDAIEDIDDPQSDKN